MTLQRFRFEFNKKITYVTTSEYAGYLQYIVNYLDLFAQFPPEHAKSWEKLKRDKDYCLFCKHRDMLAEKIPLVRELIHYYKAVPNNELAELKRKLYVAPNTLTLVITKYKLNIWHDRILYNRALQFAEETLETAEQI